MKRLLYLVALVLSFSLLLSSCALVTIPNSAEAEKKMKDLGYSVQLQVLHGELTVNYKVDQVTILTADKGDDFIQVYFFTKESDTKTFYKDRSRSLMRGVDIIKKNKYSIYRGTTQAVEDFLS